MHAPPREPGSVDEAASRSQEPPRPRPRLIDLLRAALRARHYSPRTERAYAGWVRRYIHFHRLRHPAEMAAPEVTRFLSTLAKDGRVSPSTQNQALAALLFLYREVLGVELGWLDGLVRAKATPRLPVVLSRDEVATLLSATKGTPGLMLRLMYGTGLRLLECCRLRVKDVDFARNQITVRSGSAAPRNRKRGRMARMVALGVYHRPALRFSAGPSKIRWTDQKLSSTNQRTMLSEEEHG